MILALILVLVAVIGFGCMLFIHWADRRRVCRLFAENGGTVIKMVRCRPSAARSLLGEHSSTFWRVTYSNPSGELRIAECFASCFRCKIYKDDLFYCTHCGYDLTGNTSGIFPECGQKI